MLDGSGEEGGFGGLVKSVESVVDIDAALGSESAPVVDRVGIGARGGLWRRETTKGTIVSALVPPQVVFTQPTAK